MELESLDLFEFYKDEYGLIDKGIGIGAAGIITPKQQINVINIPDYCTFVNDVKQNILEK